MGQNKNQEENYQLGQLTMVRGTYSSLSGNCDYCDTDDCGENCGTNQD